MSAAVILNTSVHPRPKFSGALSSAISRITAVAPSVRAPAALNVTVASVLAPFASPVTTVTRYSHFSSGRVPDPSSSSSAARAAASAAVKPPAPRGTVTFGCGSVVTYGRGSGRRFVVPFCSTASSSTRHCMTARSKPPTVITCAPSLAKRTFVTCEECPMYPTQSPTALRAKPGRSRHSIRRKGACFTTQG